MKRIASIFLFILVAAMVWPATQGLELVAFPPEPGSGYRITGTVERLDYDPIYGAWAVLRLPDDWLVLVWFVDRPGVEVGAVIVVYALYMGKWEYPTGPVSIFRCRTWSVISSD